MVQGWRSPIEAVAESVIDRSPSSVTRFGIRTFGTNDKVALIVGIVIILAIAAPLLGLAARRRPLAGVAGFAVFGVVGVVAALQGGCLAAAEPAALAALIGAGRCWSPCARAPVSLASRAVQGSGGVRCSPEPELSRLSGS